MKRTSRRTVLLKGGYMKRTSRETALLKGRNTRTIQLPLRHLKGVGIDLIPWTMNLIVLRSIGLTVFLQYFNGPFLTQVLEEYR